MKSFTTLKRFFVKKEWRRGFPFSRGTDLPPTIFLVSRLTIGRNKLSGNFRILNCKSTRYIWEAFRLAQTWPFILPSAARTFKDFFYSVRSFVFINTDW